MTWPTRDAPSANCFLDHFTGSSLDSAKWGSVTSGTGAVTVTDGYCQCNAPANSAAFIYYKTKIDKTKSQKWFMAINRTTGSNGNPAVLLVNGASAPTADTATNIDAKTIMARAWANQSSMAILDWYFTSGGTQNYWSGSAWTSSYSTSLNSTMPIRNDDYYILGIEIDGVNSRFRILAYGKTYTSGYTFEQGFRLFGLSDWVNFSSARSNSDIWLVVGQPYTNDADAKTYKIEWIRYIEATNNAIIEAWTAAKSSSSTGHTFRHHYSYDGRIFVPEDRSTDALAPNGTGWEGFDLQAPNVVRDGSGTDYLFYYGMSSGFTTTGIGVAKATTATPQNGPWTRGASNPIISAQAGESRVRYPYVFKDNSDPDPNKRWKAIVPIERSSDNKEQIHLVTAPHPPDSSTWTRQGIIIDLGGSGAKDEGGCQGVACVVHVGGQFEVWYQGIDASGNSHLLRAYGTNLASLTKDTTDNYTCSSAVQSITANLTGRTLTVADTTGFVADAGIVLDQDATLDNYAYSRIRKIVSSTQIELYHGLDGMTTTTPAKAQQIDATQKFGGQHIWKVGSEWWFYMTVWGATSTLGGSYNALCEQNMLYTHSGANPNSATPVMDFLASPIIARGFNSDLRSVENMGLMTTPLGSVPFEWQRDVLSGYIGQTSGGFQ